MATTARTHVTLLASAAANEPPLWTEVTDTAMLDLAISEMRQKVRAATRR